MRLITDKDIKKYLSESKYCLDVHFRSIIESNGIFSFVVIKCENPEISNKLKKDLNIYVNVEILHKPQYLE